MIKEDLLHYVWKTQKFNLKQLETKSGSTLQILDFGVHNYDSGPDFLQAKIRLNETLWIGNIEIHVFASDWIKHNHHSDISYENVILHVVYKCDHDLLRKDGSPIPVLELAGRIPPVLFKTYFKLLREELWVPCQNLIENVPEPIKIISIESLAIERLIVKASHFLQVLTQNNNDWEQSFYICLLSGFGSRVNKNAFHQLGLALPLKLLLKHRDDRFILESLLYGTAGLLDFEPHSAYPIALKKEFRFLASKYALKPIRKQFWKFMRMRPVNFPTIRISQFANLLQENPFLLRKILEAENVVDLKNLFNIRASDYWTDHFVFDKESIPSIKFMGTDMIDSIVINIIAPFIFMYGQQLSNEKYKMKALHFLEELKPEKNKIITMWRKLGLKPSNSLQTQGLIQLKKTKCDAKRCLECKIGHAILR